MTNRDKIRLAKVLRAVVLFFVWMYKKNIAKGNPAGTATNPGDVVLKMGSTGDDVKRLQKKLNQIINSATGTIILNDGNEYIPIFELLVEDGLFGHNTENALRGITGHDSIFVSAIDNLNQLTINA